MNFTLLCADIPMMSKNKIIKHLNDQGLSLRSTSVRQRRLFKAGFRMLAFKNCSINATRKQQKILFDCISNIKKNLFLGNDSYFIDFPKILLNELTEKVENCHGLEHESKFYKEDEIITFVEEKKMMPNTVKQNYIGTMRKLKSEKLNKTQKRKLRIFDEDERYTHEILQKYDWIPGLLEMDNDSFKKEVGFLAISDLDFKLKNKSKTSNYSEEFLKEIQPIMHKYLKYSLFDDLKKILQSKKNCHELLVELGVYKDKLPEVDESIMEQPDYIEKIVNRKEVKKVPVFLENVKTVRWEYRSRDSRNHSGIKQSSEMMSKMCEEIYKISDLPGFSCLKTHWTKIRYSTKKANTKYNDYMNENDIKERSVYLKKPKKLKKLIKEKGCKISNGLTEIERMDLRKICLENQIHIEKVREIQRDAKLLKEVSMYEISRDLEKMGKYYENIGGNIIYDLNFKGKPKGMCSDIAKRYHSIFRSIATNTNLYDSLNYHVKSYKKMLSRHQSRDSYGDEDY